MRQISFLNEAPRYCSADPSLQCRAIVDGEPAWYQITAEALEDHFGAYSYRHEDLLAAYALHLDRIRTTARNVFEMTGAKDIVLHSGHFRFEASDGRNEHRSASVERPVPDGS